MANSRVIQECSSVTEAQIFVDILAERGIQAFLLNEHMASVLPVPNERLGRITVLVRDEDYEAAMRVLTHQDEDEELGSVRFPNPGDALADEDKAGRSPPGELAMRWLSGLAGLVLLVILLKGLARLFLK